MKLFPKAWLCFLVLLVLSFSGCALDDYHIESESYSWHYEGLADDTTAVVSVTHSEHGTIDCHHLVDWEDGESFERRISKKYYKVGMKTLWMGTGSENLTNILPEKRNMSDDYPRWSDGCLAMDSLGGKFYCVEADRLDGYSSVCGFILIDDSNNDLDTLEYPSCGGSSLESVSFVVDYLKVNESLFEIRKGKFVSQEPAIRIIENSGNVKFVDRNGNFVMYSGKP